MAQNTRTNTARWIENEKRWRIDVTRFGVRRPFYSSTPGRKGQREANEKADRWLEAGTYNETTRISVLWESYLAHLLGEKELPNDYEENIVYYRKHFYTFSQHESIGRNQILPEIGNKRLCDLTENDLQFILKKVKFAGLTKKSAKNVQAAQNAFLKFCRMNKYTTFRPEDVKIPSGMPSKDKPVLQYEDVVKLFTCDRTYIKGHEEFERLIWAFRYDFIVGFRPGELVGYQWRDIKGNRHKIGRTINCRGVEGRGKNDNAIEENIIPSLGMMILEQQKLINPPEESLWVFDHYTQGTYLSRWNRFCEYNGITKCTMKEMRHACATWLKTLPVDTLKAHLRHSEDMRTFETYVHYLKGDEERRAVAIDEMFMSQLPFIEQAIRRAA